MRLGAFSLSLNVADIAASRDFYAKLGFSEFGGNIAENWLIMKSGDTVIGLFQGMFDTNLMTFNPGWDSDAQPLESFSDVRVVQRRLRDAGIALESEVDESGSGPGSFMVVDPDGNPILFDQHR